MSDTKIKSSNKPKTVIDKIAPGNVSAEMLIAKGIEKGMPLETMEKLLAMRRELKEEWAREQFFAALSDFQEECPIITKSEGVDYISKKGSRVRYRYAPLDVIVAAVKQPLKKYGFSYTITTKQEKDSVTAICNVHHIDGHSESTEFTIPIDPDSYMNAAHKVASALTYAKRYSFCNALGILTSDTDDDGMGGNNEQQQSEKEKPAAAEKEKPSIDKTPKHDKEWYIKQIMTGIQKMYDKEYATQEIVDNWMARLDAIGATDDLEKIRDLLNVLLIEYKNLEGKHMVQKTFDIPEGEKIPY